MDVKLFTVEEANRALPQILGLLPRLREALDQVRFHEEQVKDLEAIWGKTDIRDPDNRDNPEYLKHQERLEAGRRVSENLFQQFRDLGVEVKDPWTGLVDFHSDLDGEHVYLCWREGEPEVAHWHTLTGGFAGRMPL